MFKADALEAAPIMQRAMVALLAAAPTRGREGADLRAACNDLRAHAATLIQSDAAGTPLANCFEIAINTGISQKQLSYVRETVMAEPASSVGAILIRDSIIQMCLASEGRVIASMTFRTRHEVDDLKLAINEAFALSEERAADAMDSMTYRALVELHAALTFHLIETARPLPRLIRFEFAASMPSLQIAQRLYYDALRADELREENMVVHPAFMRPAGLALSA